jgi:hypothetical protein
MALNRGIKEHMRNTPTKSGDWIKGAIKKKGALHKELDVPSDKKIPKKKLEKATHSKNPTLKRRAILAETLKSFKNK